MPEVPEAQHKIYAMLPALFSLLTRPTRMIRFLLYACFTFLSLATFAQDTLTTTKEKINEQEVILEETVIVARSKSLMNTAEGGRLSLATDNLHQIPSLMGAPDLIKVLQLMPGVQNSGENNGYLYVRGTDPGHTLFMFDDAPVYGTSHLLGIFPFFNASHISRLEFDKTGTDMQHGSKLGALLKAESRSILPERFSIGGNIGLLAAQLHLEIPVGKKTAFYISGRQTYVDQVLMPLIESTTSDDDIGGLTYRFSDVNVTFLAHPSPGHSIRVNTFFSNDRFGLEEKKNLLSGTMKWGNLASSVSWQWKINKTQQLKQTAYMSQYHNKLGISQATIGLSVDSDIKSWGTNSSFGFEAFHIPFETGLQWSGYRISPQQIAADRFVGAHPDAKDQSINSSQLTLFLQGRPQFTPSIHAEVGIRLNCYRGTTKGSDDKTYIHVEPGISFHYAPGSIFSSYLAYACKHQYLNLITTSSVGFPTDFWLAASGNIPSQQAHSISLGSQYKVRPDMELSGNLFYNRLNNLVEYPLNVLQFNEISNFSKDVYIGKGQSYGLELMLRKTGRLSGWVSYTLSRSERRLKEIDHNRTFPAKFDRTHNLSAVAHYKLTPKWQVSVTQIYTSGGRYTAPTSWYFINNNPVKEYGAFNKAKMPDYIRTDLSVDFFLNKKEHQESVLNLSLYNALEVVNPICVLLDVDSNETGNEIKVRHRYKRLYTILPSVSWRFKF